MSNISDQTLRVLETLIKRKKEELTAVPDESKSSEKEALDEAKREVDAKLAKADQTVGGLATTQAEADLATQADRSRRVAGMTHLQHMAHAHARIAAEAADNGPLAEQLRDLMTNEG